MLFIIVIFWWLHSKSSANVYDMYDLFAKWSKFHIWKRIPYCSTRIHHIASEYVICVWFMIQFSFFFFYSKLMSEFNNFWWTAVLQCIPFAMRWKSDWTRKTNRFISNTTPFKLINICRKNAVGLRPLCFVLIVSTVSNLFQVKHVVCGIRWIFDSLTPEINRSLQVKLSIQLNGSAVFT